jgi:hypothetical protein
MVMSDKTRDECGLNLPREPVQCLRARGGEVHDILALAGFTAKTLPKEISDIRFVIHGQDACAMRRLPKRQAHAHDAASAIVAR